MKQIDQTAWMNKSLKLNTGKTLQVGNKVMDLNKNLGVVVKIDPPQEEGDHGTVYVWQLEKINYGADNCEHYAFTQWSSILRILE